MLLGLGWLLLTLLLYSLVPSLVLLHARNERRRARSGRETPLLLAAASGLDRTALTGVSNTHREIGAPAVVVGRPPRARLPLVFAHGYFGFDAIGAMYLRGEYFRGVRARLEALGHHVYLARVAPAAGVRHRAAELAEQIARLPFDRVNVIAHSMGGVDARYAISKLGLDARVASLTTIGTPHRGTPIADVATRLGEWQRLRRMLDTMGANVDGLYDLTTARMEEFNQVVTDATDVFYASVVGALPNDEGPASALLRPGYKYLRRKSGPNDGMVPAASQRWGEVLDEIAADHWAQIGWSGGFDAGRLYVAIAEELALRGL